MHDIKKLISTTYTNKTLILLGSLSLKNFIVKHVCLGAIMRCVTFYEDFLKACELRQRTLNSLVLFCGDCH